MNELIAARDSQKFAISNAISKPAVQEKRQSIARAGKSKSRRQLSRK